VNWASTNLKPLTPLEYTLHIWGALAGDLCGPSVLDMHQTYSKRIIPNKEAYDLAITLANGLIKNNSCFINASDTKSEGFNKLVQSELVLPTSTGKYIFTHSELIGYFASLSQNKDPISDLNQIDLQWPANYAYLGFCSAQDSNSEWLTTYISQEISAFPINFLNISPWLKITNKNLTWRINYIKQLVKIIQDNNAKYATRIRAIAGLVHSNDNSLPVFFRQLLSHNDNSLKELAIYAISCASRDNSFIADLISLSQKVPAKFQKNICLALSTFEEENAVHELARILLNGEEKVRQLVAECLAFNPTNGTEILQEAVTMDDIVVRRSAINGLVKLNNLWAIQTLKNLMIQDSQWVVRNAATQALEYLESENPCIPDRKLPLSETPWIIEFAGDQNLGVSIDQSVAPILLLALESKNKTDIYKALIYSTQDANQATISKMIEIATTSPDQKLINQIFITLYLLRNSKISWDIKF
jgi:HEAT repeat protein